jgi:flavin reductase (DIM6/NTAB) family NADH-FMN oxidoreductase RutF
LSYKDFIMHVTSEPAILYFGTPVVVISTVNEDGSFNLAPMSSAFWLGWRCILGLGATSQTAENLQRERECVLNLASINEVDLVDRLALTTGRNPVPEVKLGRGYRHVKDKFGIAQATPLASETVGAARIAQCPVHMEAVVEAVHGIADGDTVLQGKIKIFEVRIKRVHVEQSLLMAGEPNRVDPDKWNPLIMSFQHFYGLAEGKLQPSRLAQIPEAKYRSIDIDRANQELDLQSEQGQIAA